MITKVLVKCRVCGSVYEHLVHENVDSWLLDCNWCYGGEHEMPTARMEENADVSIIDPDYKLPNILLQMQETLKKQPQAPPRNEGSALGFWVLGGAIFAAVIFWSILTSK